MVARKAADRGTPGVTLLRMSRAWHALSPTCQLWLAGAAVVSLALVLRLYFFVGLVSGDPQDDGVYYQLAVDIFRNGTQYLHRFAGLSERTTANPIDQFAFRPLAVWPTALLFTIVGPSETAATLWPLFASLATTAIVFRIGLLTGGLSVGVFAGLLHALLPMEIINGTRILADPPLEFFCAAALLLWLEGRGRRRGWWFVLSGFAAGCGYLAKPPALFFFGLLFIWAAGEAFRRRIPAAWCGCLCGGLLLVVAAEGLFYWRHTGDVWATMHVHRRAEAFKYETEPAGRTAFGRLTVLYNNGEPLDLYRAAFRLSPGPTDQSGIFYYFFAVALACALWQRRARPMAVLGLGLFCLFEFGPTAVRFETAPWRLQYFMLPKQARYLMMMSPPFAVVGAFMLDGIRRRSPILSVLVLVGLSLSTVQAAAKTRTYYRSSLDDMRDLTELILKEPIRTFRGDWWMVEHVKIFSRYTATNVSVLDQAAPPGNLNDACLVVGGGRGPELLSDYVLSTLPPFARDAWLGDGPPGARLVWRRTGPLSALRNRDLRIYCFN